MEMIGKVAPLPTSFLLVSIVGFLISAYLITELSWKFTMLLFFAVMFIASFISMHKAPVVKKMEKR